MKSRVKRWAVHVARGFFPGWSAKQEARRVARTDSEVERIRSDIRERSRLHAAPIQQSAEYRAWESRYREVTSALEGVEKKDPYFKSQLARKLFDELDALDRQLHTLKQKQPYSNRHFFQQVSREAAHYALLRVGVHEKSLRNREIFSQLSVLAEENPYMHQFLAHQSGLVRRLGRKRGHDFLFFYQEYYRLFAGWHWAQD